MEGQGAGHLELCLPHEWCAPDRLEQDDDCVSPSQAITQASAVDPPTRQRVESSRYLCQCLSDGTRRVRPGRASPPQLRPISRPGGQAAGCLSTPEGLARARVRTGSVRARGGTAGRRLGGYSTWPFVGRRDDGLNSFKTRPSNSHTLQHPTLLLFLFYLPRQACSCSSSETSTSRTGPQTCRQSSSGCSCVRLGREPISRGAEALTRPPFLFDFDTRIVLRPTLARSLSHPISVS